jgi:hypothetical protein
MIKKFLLDYPLWNPRHIPNGNKGVPYSVFINEFPKYSHYFKQELEIALDWQEVRYTDAVMKKKIPPTFGIFQSKNILDYRDSKDMKNKDPKKTTPESKKVKEAVEEVKEKFFTQPGE